MKKSETKLVREWNRGEVYKEGGIRVRGIGGEGEGRI